MINIERSIARVVERIGLAWNDDNFSICNEKIIIRNESLYIDTSKIATNREKVEEIIRILKEELKKDFEIVAEESLYSFRVITLKQK